jgi:hypothetical protein
LLLNRILADGYGRITPMYFQVFSTTSSLNIAVYDFLRTILFFSPWVIFLGKFLNYKSLRQRTHALENGSNHMTRDMQGKKAPKRNLNDIYAEKYWYHSATKFSCYDATGASRS